MFGHFLERFHVVVPVTVGRRDRFGHLGEILELDSLRGDEVGVGGRRTATVDRVAAVLESVEPGFVVEIRGVGFFSCVFFSVVGHLLGFSLGGNEHFSPLRLAVLPEVEILFVVEHVGSSLFVFNEGEDCGFHLFAFDEIVHFFFALGHGAESRLPGGDSGGPLTSFAEGLESRLGGVCGLGGLVVIGTSTKESENDEDGDEFFHR